jgi:hypothetical protein
MVQIMENFRKLLKIYSKLLNFFHTQSLCVENLPRVGRARKKLKKPLKLSLILLILFTFIFFKKNKKMGIFEDFSKKITIFTTQ